MLGLCGQLVCSGGDTETGGCPGQAVGAGGAGGKVTPVPTVVHLFGAGQQCPLCSTHTREHRPRH